MNENEMIREKLCECDLDEAKAQIVEATQTILVDEISKQTGISKKNIRQYFGENTETMFLHKKVFDMIESFMEII